MKALRPLALLMLLWAGLSAAATPVYVRSHVDDSKDPTAHCLWWSQGIITYHQSAAGNPDTPAAPAAVSQSWSSWQGQLSQCSNLSLEEGSHSGSRAIGYASDGGTNENLVLFRAQECASVVPANDTCHATHDCGNKYDCWSQEYPAGIIALTTTTYNKDTGQLFDADVELNAGDFFFTADDGLICPDSIGQASCIAYDVQNTMTHEVGHVLGLAHSPDGSSTMYASAPWGETSKRHLDDGSTSFVCNAYPKGAASRDCVIDASSLFLGQANGCGMGGATSGLSGLVLLGLTRLVGRRSRR